MQLAVAQQTCPAALLLVHIEMMLAHAPKVMSQPVCPAINVPKWEHLPLTLRTIMGVPLLLSMASHLCCMACLKPTSPTSPGTRSCS